MIRDHAHHIALADRVSWVEHQSLATHQTLDHIHLGAIVTADFDFLQLDLVLFIDNGHLSALFSDDERVGGDIDRVTWREGEHHLNKGTGLKQARLVVKRHLNLHGPRRGVDCARSSGHFGGNFFTAKLILLNLRLLAWTNKLCIGLRHIDIDLQAINARDHKKWLGGAIDQVADVNIALGHNASERRHNALENRELL